MHRRTVVAVILWLVVAPARAQDTFSIVAVDTVTREIGSAGASCVSAINGVGAYIISDVIEGVGAIHTQASWLTQNQQNAHQQMLLGRSPDEIIAWLTANDAQGNPTVRQYGVVDLTRRGASGAYTGVNCTTYRGHAIGPGYAVQGNILLGQQIIDTIRNTYLRTRGPLADRLMRALQAAQIIGADTRCASRNTSTRSGFIKVVRAGDGARAYLLKIIPDTPIGTDPIGLLRQQFDQWKDSLRTTVDPFLSTLTVSRETLLVGGSLATITITPKNNSDTLLASGRTVLLGHTGAGVFSGVTDSGNGTYFATVISPAASGTDTISAVVVSGSDTVRLAARRVVVYLSATAINTGGEARSEFRLEQNYPNPFNPSTSFEFKVPSSELATLKVFDLLGREVATLVNEPKQPGTYAVQWDVGDRPSGVYVYRLTAGRFTSTRKMIVIR